jgi:hypothetical protein
MAESMPSNPVAMEHLQDSEPSGAVVFRNGVLCCFIFLACYWLAWPVTRMGFIDDWSFFKTAQIFAYTGHIVYNGWSDPMVGWLIPWGALFIKIFGNSYMAVRLSILPITLLTLLLFHSTLIRFNITARNAFIGTLTLGLCPLLLPFAACYMTDVPCLFVVVLCLYLCQRATSADTAQTAIAWLLLAALSNVAGGTTRQAAWLGALVMVPCTGWLLHKQRSVLYASLTIWLASVGAIVACMHWFARQPYAPQASIAPKLPNSFLLCVFEGIFTLDLMGALLLCLLLMILPVLAIWLPYFGKKFDHYIVLFCMGLLPMLALKYLTGNLGIVWPASTLNWELSTQQHSLLGTPQMMQGSLFPIPARILVSVVLLAALLGCIIAVRQKGWKLLRAARPDEARQIFWLLVPFSIAYCALLILAVQQGLALDKYVFLWMPFAIIASIWLYQRCIRLQLPRTSVAILIVYAAFAVAATHTLFAWHRARFAAIQELRSAGIPPTEIQAGFEYDGWTQIEQSGHVNNKRVKNPPGAYQPPRTKADPQNLCAYNFLAWAPSLHPKYAVDFGPAACFLPSKFPPVNYTAWLPPFHRTVYIQKVPDKIPTVTAPPR